MFHVREPVSNDRNDRGIFRQFFRHDFVQRVSSGVVIIEIKTAVLDWTERGNTRIFHRFDISTTMFDEIQHARA